MRALQAEHGPALLGYVTRHHRRPAARRGRRAGDAVASVAQGRSLEGDASSLRSWLFTVAHNLAIDEHRARAARREEADAELAEVDGGRAARPRARGLADHRSAAGAVA